jgi:hypothetical protein
LTTADVLCLQLLHAQKQHDAEQRKTQAEQRQVKPNSSAAKKELR